MTYPDIPYEPKRFPQRPRPPYRIVGILAALFLLLIFGRSICAFIIDYFWWRELGQVPTWILVSVYRYAPGLAAWVIIFAVLWISHALGVKHAGERLRDHRAYAWIAAAAAVLIALIIQLAVVDGWTVARYFGGHGLASSSEWHDPVFGRPLGFYFFDLPFYDMLIGFLTACTLGGALAYYLAARGWQIRREFPDLASRTQIDFNDLRSLGRLESGLLKGLTAAFLVMLAAEFWLGRYDLMLSDHGQLMVGIDYVQQHVGLPLQTVLAGASLLAAVLVLLGRRKLALGCALVLVVDWVLPPIISGAYVKPNELELERPFLQRHIEATRSAFGLSKAREEDFPAQNNSPIDFARNRPLLNNVRLWDWGVFRETLSQTQPLRPYTYQDVDVDRYQIGGQLRQVLLAPRELDLSQLGEAQDRWINKSLIFTHGYGLALAEANRITSEGLPVLLVQNAPVEVLTPSLKITRPQIYYGESVQGPVFVRTAQPEYDYPSGSSEVTIRYNGSGGFPMSSRAMRAVAAVAQGDWNILLTSQLTPESRMMIRRSVLGRLGEMAQFITWDSDPYMVITNDGHLQWIVDGYTTSDAHPYSREVSFTEGERFNYIRNSVKATVDAYNGDVHMYVFDETDPLIQAYRRLFPDLFLPASAMPADLRAHTRAPEMLFRTQAEMYRIYHMRDPDSYYNRADMWDLATFTMSQGAQPEPVPPVYLIATLPGETQPEFLLMIPFTPRNKQNLIGLMVARCDGPHMGELVFLNLPKQEIIPGPIQVEARINQDSTISKDLSLWNQQGSQVIRNQILTLPIDKTFLYVEPIYLQAPQARMPQLKKVALVMGNSLVYADTYEQALQQLEAMQNGQVPPQPAATESVQATTKVVPPKAPTSDMRIEEIREHLQRYRDLSAQGKWAEAGKELEAIQAAVKK